MDLTALGRSGEQTWGSPRTTTALLLMRRPRSDRRRRFPAREASRVDADR